MLSVERVLAYLTSSSQIEDSMVITGMQISNKTSMNHLKSSKAKNN